MQGDDGAGVEVFAHAQADGYDSADDHDSSEKGEVQDGDVGDGVQGASDDDAKVRLCSLLYCCRLQRR